MVLCPQLQWSSGVTVYYVSALYNGKAVIRPYASGAVIPAKTPVLVECSSSSAANNQIELLTSTASAPTHNLLKGVFFDYTYGDYIRNVSFVVQNLFHQAADRTFVINNKYFHFPVIFIPQIIGRRPLPPNIWQISDKFLSLSNFF